MKRSLPHPPTPMVPHTDFHRYLSKIIVSVKAGLQISIQELTCVEERFAPHPPTHPFHRKEQSHKKNGPQQAWFEAKVEELELRAKVEAKLRDLQSLGMGPCPLITAITIVYVIHLSSA